MIPSASRMLSCSVALVVGLLSAWAFSAVTTEAIAFVGVPVAGLVGAWLGPRVNARSRLPIKVALAMAAMCTVGGAYAVGLLAGIYAPLIGTLGLIYFGIPAFLLLLVPAWVWATLTALLARRGWA
jgi:hypothetical protein